MFLRKLSQLKPVTNGLRTMSYIPKNRLDGKVAVVTASTEGIGYGIARRLASEGAKVFISSRKQKNVDGALSKLKAEGLDVEGIVCHVSNGDDRKKLLEETTRKFGGIDILISNAATNPHFGGVLDCDEAAWDKIFDTNVKASFLLAKEVTPYMIKRGGGSIVFVSSIAGYQPFNLLGAYSVSKTALLGLTKAASLQLASENITVNCVAPGMVKTKFSAAVSIQKMWLMACLALTDSQEAADESLSRIPLDRFGTVEDIAGATAFLVSNDARYITGETIVPAGGMASRL